MPSPQTKRRHTIAHALILLLSLSAMSGVATAENVSTFTAVLTYPPGPRASETSPVFHGPHGKAYEFRLDPEENTDGNLVVVELVMEGTSRSERGSNRLYPTGRLHGYQKWYFAASDFAHGPAKSIYGSSRTIDVPKLGLEVRVTVVRVAVKATPATSSAPAQHRFVALTLKVVAQAVSAGGR